MLMIICAKYEQSLRAGDATEKTSVAPFTNMV